MPELTAEMLSSRLALLEKILASARKDISFMGEVTKQQNKMLRIAVETFDKMAKPGQDATDLHEAALEALRKMRLVELPDV